MLFSCNKRYLLRAGYRYRHFNTVARAVPGSTA